MFKNYLLITLRNLYREKIYAGINIFGLSLALACSLILVLYIRSELSYDKHHLNHERIVRITGQFTSSGTTNYFAITSTALGPLLIREYPQVGDFVRFQPVPRGVLRNDDVSLYWDDVYLADDNVFDVFTHESVYGDLSTALVDPSSIAISESFAKSYFGEGNPIGQSINTDTFEYQVTAVFKDLPDNSHLKYSALLSYNRLAALGQSDDNVSARQLFGVNIYTYLLTPEGFDQSSLKRILDEFYEKAAGELGRQIGLEGEYFYQPLTDVHFSDSGQYDEPTGNIFYIYGFAAVAIFVLLIACINYTNLAIARATKRAKEVGMRRVIGASKKQLALQFMGESIFYALVAMVIALVMVEVADTLTSISDLFGKPNLLNFSNDPSVLLVFAGLAISVGLLAGTYPTFYLTAISPLAALTATKKSRGSKFRIGTFLVFIQFFVSIGVVACTLLMNQQMNYVANKSLGFEKENSISILMKGVDVISKVPVIRNELMTNPNVLGVTSSSFTPGSDIAINLADVENNEGILEPTNVNNFAVGENFIEVMGMEVLEGRDFSTRLLTDVGTSLVVNETLVKKMGWENPIGKRLRGGPIRDGRIVGVVKDIHFSSLHQEVGPMLIQQYPDDDLQNVPEMQRNIISRNLIVKIAGDDVYQTINHIESVMSQFDPKHPFEFDFFDTLLDKVYTSETNLMKLTGIFAGICIFISCMGLYGLSAFTTEQRTKEIGVRKVLGASTSQIILMLSKGQMILIIVAAVIASAVSYYVMNDWLSSFAYRTTIQFWVFFVATLAVAFVAFITVAFQSGKTAQSNPVTALRYE
ncbi:ABC transporter permease [Aurantivibrio infirmus]